MGPRVFICHRPGDAAGEATALARDLASLLGEGQAVRLGADPDSAERWREALAGAPGNAPILLALVTPRPAPDDAVSADDVGLLRARLDAGLAAGIPLLPLLGDGVAEIAPDAALPPPFHRLSHLARQPLRPSAWLGDLARLGETLHALGVRPLSSTVPDAEPLPARNEGPITTPMPLDADRPVVAAAGADTDRRGVLGLATVALLLAGAAGAWLWRQRRPTDLSGPWRARIGLRGESTSRDGTPMLVTLAQKDRGVALSSVLDIASDPQWEPLRESWKKRNGGELRQLIYRGEGELVDDEAGSRGGLHWVRISVQITTPGVGSETIDSGQLRGVIDRGDQSIHGRLWLESEQAERVVDLRRGD